MRAAKLKEHPPFRLMGLEDAPSVRHMQMPRWLFSDPRYAGMALEAKVVYTFLLSRFQLSRRNGWTNGGGEVFVIYPRRELARELGVCEQRVTAAFRALADLGLIWERRCGRGEANQIYLAAVEPMDGPGAGASAQEPQSAPVRDGGDRGSKNAVSAAQEPRDRRPSDMERSDTEQSLRPVGRSVPRGPDGRADDEEELEDILEGCGLDTFEPETARVFENAIERLFYSERFRVGDAVLPRSRIRARLRQLSAPALQDAEEKLHANLGEVRNSTAYAMATVFNCISECESDLMVDPYLNHLRRLPRAGPG